MAPAAAYWAVAARVGVGVRAASMRVARAAESGFEGLRVGDGGIRAICYGDRQPHLLSRLAVYRAACLRSLGSPLSAVSLSVVDRR